MLLESSKNIGEFEHWPKHSPIHNPNTSTRSPKLDQIINYKESYLELNIIILFIYFNYFKWFIVWNSKSSVFWSSRGKLASKDQLKLARPIFVFGLVQTSQTPNKSLLSQKFFRVPRGLTTFLGSFRRFTEKAFRLDVLNIQIRIKTYRKSPMIF